MSEFLLFPAIDLRAGEVVRLKQGRKDQQTTYESDPAQVAQRWRNEGATWLHVINLDGAFGEEVQTNLVALERILDACENQVKVQYGGGIRTLEGVAQALDLGLTRVVLGTMALENPTFGQDAIKTFGADKIAFALDAFNGELMSRGWQENTGLSLISYAHALMRIGASTLIYTNIQKDGMQTGVDWEKAKQLADGTELKVIASGGVGTLEDIKRVKSAGLNGVIVGRALYEKKFSFQEALTC